jgi:hypothetical protein
VDDVRVRVRVRVRPLAAVPSAWNVSEDDPVAVLKQHILDETVEAASGIQFLLEGLRAQWNLTWEALLLADAEVLCRRCHCHLKLLLSLSLSSSSSLPLQVWGLTLALHLLVALYTVARVRSLPRLYLFLSPLGAEFCGSTAPGPTARAAYVRVPTAASGQRLPAKG